MFMNSIGFGMVNLELPSELRCHLVPRSSIGVEPKKWNEMSYSVVFFCNEAWAA